MLDCAIGIAARIAANAPSAEASTDTSRAIRHPTWTGGTFTRKLSEGEWSLIHPDGRISQVFGKDWNSWNGEGWPLGWTVRRPDGTTFEVDEDQWGDEWFFAATGDADTGDSVPVLTGTVSIGEIRYTYTATKSGVLFEPKEGGSPVEIRAGQVEVLRVMPMSETQAFAMFATTVDPDDIFQTMTFWGDGASASAADVGSILGARILLAE